MISSLGAFIIRLVTGVRVDHAVAHPPGVRVYYANHSSHLDFVVIWAALPTELRTRTRPVAAADYWNKGPLRRWLAGKIFRAVLIPRGKITKHDDPIGAMAAVLDAGNDLILFPEGTRGDGTAVDDFRTGLHALSLRNPEAELVPVYLENLNRILPKGEIFLVPLMACVTFGKPCDVPRKDECRKEFLARARQALLDLHHPHELS